MAARDTPQPAGSVFSRIAGGAVRAAALAGRASVTTASRAVMADLGGHGIGSIVGGIGRVRRPSTTSGRSGAAGVRNRIGNVASGGGHGDPQSHAIASGAAHTVNALATINDGIVRLVGLSGQTNRLLGRQLHFDRLQTGYLEDIAIGMRELQELFARQSFGGGSDGERGGDARPVAVPPVAPAAAAGGLAGLLSSPGLALGAGAAAGIAASRAGAIARGVLSGAGRLVGAIGSRIPIIGGAISGAIEFVETGSAASATAAGGGAVLGALLGGAVGGPIGAVAGAIIGQEALKRTWEAVSTAITSAGAGGIVATRSDVASVATPFASMLGITEHSTLSPSGRWRGQVVGRVRGPRPIQATPISGDRVETRGVPHAETRSIPPSMSASIGHDVMVVTESGSLVPITPGTVLAAGPSGTLVPITRPGARSATTPSGSPTPAIGTQPRMSAVSGTNGVLFVDESGALVPVEPGSVIGVVPGSRGIEVVTPSPGTGVSVTRGPGTMGVGAGSSPISVGPGGTGLMTVSPGGGLSAVEPGAILAATRGGGLVRVDASDVSVAAQQYGGTHMGVVGGDPTLTPIDFGTASPLVARTDEIPWLEGWEQAAMAMDELRASMREWRAAVGEPAANAPDEEWFEYDRRSKAHERELVEELLRKYTNIMWGSPRVDDSRIEVTPGETGVGIVPEQFFPADGTRSGGGRGRGGGGRSLVPSQDDPSKPALQTSLESKARAAEEDARRSHGEVKLEGREVRLVGDNMTFQAKSIVFKSTAGGLDTTVGSFGDLGGLSGSGVAPRSIAPGQRGSANRAMEILTQGGLSPEQAAGVVGNLMQESNLNPNAVGDGGRAKGIAQWHPDRWRGLVAYANAKGTSPYDFDTQVEYILHEMEGPEARAGAMLRGTTTAAAAAYAFSRYYERPSAAHAANPTRAGYAESALSEWQRIAASSPVSSVANASPTFGASLLQGSTGMTLSGIGGIGTTVIPVGGPTILSGEAGGGNEAPTQSVPSPVAGIFVDWFNND